MEPDDDGNTPHHTSSRKPWYALAGFVGLLLFVHSMNSASNDDKSVNAVEEAPAPKAERRVAFIGEKVRITEAYVACKDKADLSRIKALAVEDHAAAAKVAGQKDCSLMNVGDVFTVASSSAWSGATCLREQGEPDCLWFPLPFVEKVP